MIRVLILEEVRAISEMIATVLCSEADVEVIGQAANLDEVKMAINRCDVALINARYPETLPSLVWNVHALSAEVKIVVMGLAPLSGVTYQCIEAGMSAHVVREAPLPELLRTIRSVCKSTGLKPAQAATAPRKFAPVLTHGAETLLPTDVRMLTRREREVLALVQQGLTNQEIARFLVIELGTVKNHVHRILRKLNIASRRETVHPNYQMGNYTRFEPSVAGMFSN